MVLECLIKFLEDSSLAICLFDYPFKAQNGRFFFILNNSKSYTVGWYSLK